MSLIVELIKERERLIEAIKAIDLIINYHTEEADADAVQAVIKTETPSNLKLEFFTNNTKFDEVKPPKEEFRVGDAYEFTKPNVYGARYLTVGKVYYNTQPGRRLIILDDDGKTRKYSLNTVKNWFKYKGHASEQK